MPPAIGTFLDGYYCGSTAGALAPGEAVESLFLSTNDRGANERARSDHVRAQHWQRGRGDRDCMARVAPMKSGQLNLFPGGTGASKNIALRTHPTVAEMSKNRY